MLQRQLEKNNSKGQKLDTTKLRTKVISVLKKFVLENFKLLQNPVLTYTW
jgi:hypothetical protein